MLRQIILKQFDYQGKVDHKCQHHLKHFVESEGKNFQTGYAKCVLFNHSNHFDQFDSGRYRQFQFIVTIFQIGGDLFWTLVQYDEQC